MSETGDEPAVEAAGIPAGTVIGGKYVVERVLGRGGMGVVVAARHLQLREPVALKFLHPEVAKKAALVTRFEREARAAARIKSEHVARVLDVGSHEGAPFIVMELLAGNDLHKVSAQRGPLPWNEAAFYLVQACEVVAEAHLYGIIHRDLKPANLFLTRRADGSPLLKVLDFGISKIMGEADENLTATTDILGSPLYMSPEQIESPRDVDARTDVWALGAILYKLLSGRAAFAAQTAASSLAKIVKDAPPPLRAARPDVPPDLEAIVLHCLEKNPAHRMATAADLGQALQPFAGLGPPEATAAGASYSRNLVRARRRPWALGGAAVATVAGAGLAIWIVASGRTPASSAMGPTTPMVAASASASAAPPTPSQAPSAPSAVATATPTASVGASAEPRASASASASAVPGQAVPAKGPKGHAAPGGDAFSDRL